MEIKERKLIVELCGRVRERQNIFDTAENKSTPHHNLSTLEFVKSQRAAKAKMEAEKRGCTVEEYERACRIAKNAQERRKYNESHGISGGLYDGPSGYYISSGKKKVGSVTNLAESKI